MKLISQKAMNIVVSHLSEVRDEVHDTAKRGGDLAKANLGEARGSTHWHKIFGPGHLTNISVSQGAVDSFFNLNAPNPMAIEFGHAPSGVFGEGGMLGHIETRAPRGLYILTRASHMV